MNILVLNAGSSSLKFRLFEMDALRPLSEPERILAEGQVERIGKPDARLTFSAGPAEAAEQSAVRAGSVTDSTHLVVDRIKDSPALAGPSFNVDAVGHRIVHGGARFYKPALVDEAVLRDIHELTELAPLHNPLGLAGIEAVREAMPDVRNVAVFDTAFHHELPEEAARYALPGDLTERLQLRRYGFHGISYRYVSERLQLCLERPAADLRLIICHLGNGASVCAVRGGRSVDTSMGFTPLEGLIMGTRSGDVDPGLILHLLRRERLTPDAMDELLNRKSGLLGLSGRSGDVRDLEGAAKDGDASAQLALECFAYRVRKYIGAYAAALGGVDALVFTAGIGEHSAATRARICRGLDFLGLHLDDPRNDQATGHGPAAIGAVDAGRVWIVPTDEERQIAREVFSLLQ